MMHLTIEALKNQFFQHEYPYWRVYRGNSKTPMGKFNSDEEYEGEDLLEYSWMQLEEFLLSFPSGRVNVQLRKNSADAQNRAIVLPVNWGSEGSSPSVSGVGHPAPAMHNNQFLQMSQQMMQMQQNFFTQLMTMQGEKIRLENLVDRLEEEVEHAAAPPPQMELMKEGIGLIKTYVTSKMMAGQQRPAGQLGTLGQKPKTEQQQPEQKSQQGYSFDFNAIIQDCQVIAANIPEYHINKVMRALATFVMNDPDQAKLFLSHLIQDDE